MFQRVVNYVNQYHMLSQGDGIVAGVSGGADSVCLLFVLRKIQESLGGRLYAAHINHGLRGAEADGDEEFVRCLCEKWQIPFYSKRVKLREIAQEKKMTEEEAGRLVRYEFFRQIAEETGAAKIAVGHNANDNVETLLFHLIRGSGLKGLGGILPVQGQIIRPLLCVERKEIEAFAKENGLDFCMDKTNLEDTYTRNRIRHRLLPIMEEINPAAVEAVGRAAGTCAEAAGFLEAEGKAALAEFTEEFAAEDGAAENAEDHAEKREESGTVRGLRIRKEAFETLHPVVAKELLMQALSAAAGSRKDIGAVHIEALIALQAGETGKVLDLPYGIRAENRYRNLLFYRKEVFLAYKEKTEYAIELVLSEGEAEGKIDLPDGGYILYAVENYEKKVKIPKNRYTKWLDCDIIKDTLHLRTRRKGDWIQVLAEGGRKKLKEYLVNEKIPREDRDRLVLLAEGDEILWVLGYRLSEKVKVKADTKRVLKLTYVGGNSDGAEEREGSGSDFPGGCGETHSGTGR